jgi:COMC family
MKFESIKSKKFQTLENADLQKLTGGGGSSSSSTTSVNGVSDSRTDSDPGGGGITSSASIVNGVVSFDA